MKLGFVVSKGFDNSEGFRKIQCLLAKREYLTRDLVVLESQRLVA